MAALARTNGSTEFGADVLAVLENPDTTGSDLLDAVLRKSRRSGGFVRSQRQWAEVIRGLPTGSGDERAQGLAARGTHDDPAVAVADLVLAGYPDRLARRREGRPGVFLLRSGGEIEVKRGETALADSEWIAAIDLDARSGGTGPGRLHLGCAIPPELVGALVDSTDPDDLSLRTVCDWEPTTGRVRTLRTRMLGAIELDTDTRRAVDSEDLLPLVVERVAADGPAVFPSWGSWPPRGHGWRSCAQPVPGREPNSCRISARITCGPPLRTGCRPCWERAEFRKFAPTADQLRAVLTAQMDHQQRRALDDFAPRSWVGPTGREFRLSYGTVDGDPSTVVLSARLQHLLGVDEHPTIGPHHTPVLVELLSPAGRPLQRTTDLPGFWRGTYSQVRRDAWPLPQTRLARTSLGARLNSPLRVSPAARCGVGRAPAGSVDSSGCVQAR
ncbi:MAG: ATP-dependent helicase C-terminal domain-containing protein [Microthrixaceae bacterium]